MKNYKEILVSVIFIVILILPGVDSWFHFLPPMENNENRALNVKPKFRIPLHDSFPQAMEDYYDDNFDFRNQFLWLNSKLRFHLFKIPPYSNKAFLGRNGWMFHIKDQMEHYYGNNLADEEELRRYYEIINYRKKFLDSLGCKYYFAVVPSKTSVYPEYLPLSKRKSVEKTLTDQIVSIIDTISGMRVIDLRDALTKGKSDGIRLYNRTGTHWNDYGSYIAYKAIIDTISGDFPELKPFPISDYNIGSEIIKAKGLTKMMGIFDGIYETKITCKPQFETQSRKGEKRNYEVIKNFPYANEYELVYNINNSQLPKMLLIRDSFGFALIPYLSEHFSESVYIFDGWHHWLNEDIVLNEKPDIYIQLVLESYIPNIYVGARHP